MLVSLKYWYIYAYIYIQADNSLLTKRNEKVLNLSKLSALREFETKFKNLS